MRIYLSNKAEEDSILGELNLSATAVALGQFDAIHIGHIEIIRRVVEYARENNIKSLVYMFENDPLEIISGRKTQSINSLDKRFKLIKALGVDIVVARRFDMEYMDITYADFVKRYISDKFKAKFVAVGYNYRFGKGGEGDVSLLRSLCDEIGVKACIVPEVKLDGEEVSSTIIRSKISDGDVAGAARMMGRCFSVKGTVIEGNKIGKGLGFPTANMELQMHTVTPRLGVYRSLAHIDGGKYASMTNIGGKPTVDGDNLSIETHIDGSFGELYGKTVEIELCEYMREIIKFESLEDLAEQLKKDKEQITNNK